MRGVGSVLINVINNLPNHEDDKYIFYVNREAEITVEELLKSIKLKPNLFEIRDIRLAKSKINRIIHRLTRFKKILSILKPIKQVLLYSRRLRVYKEGSGKYENVTDLDAFIQFDQNEPLAKLKHGAKNFLIAYDLIPYILEKDYLWSYSTSRSKGLSIYAAISSSLKRRLYARQLFINASKAYKIIAISETTKKDFHDVLNINNDKIAVISLGIEKPTSQTKGSSTDGIVNRYKLTSWGYITQKESLIDKHFLLFIGGVDNRRKLDDVVTAFNHLRAQGDNIKLVLAGDIMLGPEAITTKSAREALQNSSYLSDILFLGFVDNKTREWLYSNATAFIFPSIYEGVGLPVLEAMSYHTPVIAYDNSAIREVAGDNPIYAEDALSIIDSVRYILKLNKQKLSEITERAYKNTLTYRWGKTAKKLIDTIHE
jgi:glycosyltransferase involved in cell wall biosynthesis